MLTGDTEATAEAIAKQTGIKHFKRGATTHKAAFVKELQVKGRLSLWWEMVLMIVLPWQLLM